MPGEEAKIEEDVIVIRIGLKQIVIIFLAIAFLFLAGVLLLEHLKPKLNLKVELLPNNTVVISGRLTDGLNHVSGEYVAIEVRDENGTTVWIDAVRTFVDGYFETVFTLKEDAGGRFDVYVNTVIVSEKTSFHAGR